MKRFIFSILFVSVFCVGLGALVDKAGAKFKSDEKALALIQKARLAIGGDSAIAGVQSMVIVGKTTRNMKIDATDRTIQGETEITMQLPDKLMKMIKIGKDGGGEDMKMIDKQVNVVVVGAEKGKMQVTVDTDDDGNGAPVKKIVIKKDDGTVQEFTGAEADKIIAADGASAGKAVKRIVIKRPDGSTQEYTGAEADKVIAQNGGGNAVWTSKDGKTVNVKENVVVNRAGEGDHDSMKHNEMLRLTLSLLLTAPQGMDVSYTFGGESSVDGTACNIVNAEFAGTTFKLYLGQTSNLPVMMTYTGMRMPQMMRFHAEGGKPGDDAKKDMVFTRTVEGPPMDKAEFNVKFSDYRSINGIQLPYKWTQTVGGASDETFDVTSYDINPANIADRFSNQNVKVRIQKDPK